jgi:UDP-N-acetylglucosamine/UDP-N-acetyl-alpha-D-glucosaminouronate 4-epimerase
MKTLITGGAGFIGSHIAEGLLAAGHQVRVLDNLSSGKRENLLHLGDAVELVVGDVRDRDALDAACDGCEVVFHQAAVVSVPYSVEHPQESHDVNIQGTFNTLQAARGAGVRRVLLACSAAVYGEEPTLPKRETMAPAPLSPYGLEKITGEYYLGVFNALYGVETVSLRYFNVFGPRQDPGSPYSGVISVFVDRALSGQRPTIYGDGEQSRDFVYVGNVVRANLLAAAAPGAAGRCYNIGCGEAITLNALLEALGELTGRSMTPEYGPERAGDIRDSVADISRARQELGYAPDLGLMEGLTALLEHERAKRG